MRGEELQTSRESMKKKPLGHSPSAQSPEFSSRRNARGCACEKGGAVQSRQKDHGGRPSTYSATKDGEGLLRTAPKSPILAAGESQKSVAQKLVVSPTAER